MGPVVTASDVRRGLKEKEEIKSKIEPLIGREGVERALRDHHSKRAPIPCGMTIHTGLGCSYGCAYCYIYDMGFKSKPTVYPLTGQELAYALLSNPYMVRGPWGTLLAFGSVTEPFMKETRERALEYLGATREFLGNPQQVSTKTALGEGYVERLARTADPEIDVLVSMTTLSAWRRLEPGASPPDSRIEFMRLLAERRVGATLFLRPIIPGVTDREAEQIISRAADAGVERVVLGTLRVSRGILKRLMARGAVDPGVLEPRIPRPPREAEQIPIRARDLKERIAKTALDYGMKVLPASCSANIESHGQYCNACSFGPCGDPRKAPIVKEEAVLEIMDASGLRPLEVDVSRGRIVVRYRGSRRGAERAKHLIVGFTRLRPVLSRA